MVAVPVLQHPVPQQLPAERAIAVVGIQWKGGRTIAYDIRVRKNQRASPHASGKRPRHLSTCERTGSTKKSLITRPKLSPSSLAFLSSRSRQSAKQTRTKGIEPLTFGSEVRRAIHCATPPVKPSNRLAHCLVPNRRITVYTGQLRGILCFITIQVRESTNVGGARVQAQANRIRRVERAATAESAVNHACGDRRRLIHVLGDRVSG